MRDLLGERVWICAAVGNAAMIFWLAGVLAYRGALFEGTLPVIEDLASLPAAVEVGEPPQCVVLVVLDALAAETAADAQLMPNLTRLATEGRRGVAVVESLVPSTVAGIETLVEGVVPPPGSFLRDFGSRPSSRAGLLGAAQRAGRRTFVAGPALWRDLYGDWLDDGVFPSTFHHADSYLLAEALAAVQSGTYGLVILHLSEGDDLAHVHGRASPGYRDGVRRYDDALGVIRSAVQPAATALLVTSDHGLAAGGGHAGPEPSVLRTPLILWGDVFQELTRTDWRQADVPRLLTRVLGGVWEEPAARSGVSLSGGRAALPVVVVFAALLVAYLGRVAAARRLGAASWLLHGSLWGAGLLWWWGGPVLALLSLALAVVAAGSALDSDARIRSGEVVLRALSSGVLLGVSRLAMGWGLLDRTGFGVLVVACLTTLAFAALSSVRTTTAVRRGIWAAHLPVAAAYLLGESVSLSTINVRWAFPAMDGSWGLFGAILLAALPQTAPSLIAVVVTLPSWLRMESPDLRASFVSVAAVFAGEVLVSGVLFGAGVLTPPWGALTVGLLVRLFAEIQFLFLAAALSFGVYRCVDSWSARAVSR